MNDFSRTELGELRRCLTYMIKGGTTPYSCATIALNKKLREMYERYCDHNKPYTKLGITVCLDCNQVIKNPNGIDLNE